MISYKVVLKSCFEMQRPTQDTFHFIPIYFAITISSIFYLGPCDANFKVDLEDKGLLKSGFKDHLCFLNPDLRSNLA